MRFAPVSPPHKIVFVVLDERDEPALVKEADLNPLSDSLLGTGDTKRPLSDAPITLEAWRGARFAMTPTVSLFEGPLCIWGDLQPVKVSVGVVNRSAWASVSASHSKIVHPGSVDVHLG